MNALPKGGACSWCRSLKVRCDALKPTCSRCQQGGTKCVYPGVARRRPRVSVTMALEARAIELELIVHKLTFNSTHYVSLASANLLRRLQYLATSQASTQISPTVDTAWLPIYPNAEAGNQQGRINPGEDVTGGYTSVINRVVVEHRLQSHDWTKFDEISLSLSLHLINLFLPYRSHYYFFIDIPRFLHCVSLPPSHPDSIHPCLLNACYLGACSVSRGSLASLQPYFIQRTRHFLQQALMFADRITHFLWASLILGCFFGRDHRLQESFGVVVSATRLASACGLTLSRDNPAPDVNGYRPSEYLLPPPKHEVEAADRIRLAHALYMADQTSPIFGGSPGALAFDPRWSLNPEEAALRYQNDQGMTTKELLAELWQTDMHIKTLILRMFQKATNFARFASEKGYRGLEEEYLLLGAQIDQQRRALPLLSDPIGLRPLETFNTFNPHLLFAHTTLYGSGLVLHSVLAGDDTEARRKMLECLRALVGICEHVRGHKRLRLVQLGLLNLVHIINALRVIIRELRRPEVKENARLSASYCYAIELLLDFIDDTIVLFPAWADTPVIIKDKLAAALVSLVA
ncbi:hypothetical protein DL93DRAFT_2233180 [Clavulina sp. PMI_390]|nr:hypothetical protein DL93DRAFT_2233180 [Clavulina sp. PMI_390]